MKQNQRNPLLYKGEVLGKAITKKSGGGGKEPEIEFEEARLRLLKDVARTKRQVEALPVKARLPNEVILTLKVDPEFSSSGYSPDSLLNSEMGIQEVGSRSWSPNSNRKLTSKKGRLFFIRTTENSFSKIESKLNRSESSLPQKFIRDVKKIVSFGLAPAEEQFDGIDKKWQEGCLEAVLHPFAIDAGIAEKHFLTVLKESGVDSKRVQFRKYGHGVTFVSFDGDKNVLKNLRGYNPLRTIHPLSLRALQVSRSGSIPGGPRVPVFTKMPKIKIGVIDGGLISNPYLDNYVEFEECIPQPAFAPFAQHGTLVSGAVLYGSLNRYSAKDTLPSPIVMVKNFRVLWKKSQGDLYDVIDAIERIVPLNPGIKVYNLSLGPAGPILDDSITRFTLACDLLSKKYGVLFCVAVGNDGDQMYDRIQAPSDMANGLAVGAYSIRNPTKFERASYSCKGPGREGSKMKPDFLAFGGCDHVPIHVIGSDIGEKFWTTGTSIAAPIVSGIAGRLIGSSNNAIDALVCRALLIHAANENNSTGHNIESGHGFLSENIEEIISSPESSYTLIYKAELAEGEYASFDVPWINSLQDGKALIRLTTSVLTEVDENKPDNYTKSSVVTSFYPNKDKYTFKKGKHTKTVDVAENPEIAEELIDDGWKQNAFPVTSSGSVQFETDGNSNQPLKWDTNDSRRFSKMCNGIKDPVLHVHAIGKGTSSDSKVKFAIVLAIQIAKNVGIDLYQEVIKRYPVLIPVKTNVEVPVKINVGN